MPGLSRPDATSGAQVQITLGTLARDAHQALKRAQDGWEFLQDNDDQALLRDFQINATDAAALRAAFAELRSLWLIYRGEAAQPQPRNFRAANARIHGLGF